MPSKIRDLFKPSIYLDNSTLCDAFKAFSLGGASPSDLEYRRLFLWVERVAHEANLCMSVFHLAELGRWGDTKTADGMARWYDRLPIVWVRSITDVQNAEEEYWVKVAASVSPLEGVDAFAPSLLAAFHALKRDEVAAFLASKEPIMALLEANRTKGHKEEIEGMLEFAREFRANRAWAEAAGWTADRKRDETAYNRRVDLRLRAMEADARLEARGDGEYAQKSCSGGDVQDLLVDLVDGNATAMPCYRAMQRFNDGFIAFVIKKQAGSAQERKGLSGSFHDLIHLSVGAAYCDVFTCDAMVSGWLGDFRQTLGLPSQLAVGGRASGAKGFVDDLMATWP